MDLVEQFTAEVDGERYSAFKFENVDAATAQLAKGRMRGWARKEFPTARPINIKVLEVEREGKAQTRVSDFVPDSFQRNDFSVIVGIKE